MKGSILIARPYLGDPNFERTVVLLCEHNEEGAFGLVLNQKLDNKLSDFFEDIYVDFPVYLGGPVEKNTLHYLHKRGDLIEGAIPLIDGVYWSGNFDQIKSYLNQGMIDPSEIKFFLGYSGWSPHQLEDELEEEVWVQTDTTDMVVFEPETKEIWHSVLRNLGGEYKIMANAPVDPRLN